MSNDDNENRGLELETFDENNVQAHPGIIYE